MCKKNNYSVKLGVAQVRNLPSEKNRDIIRVDIKYIYISPTFTVTTEFQDIYRQFTRYTVVVFLK